MPKLNVKNKDLITAAQINQMSAKEADKLFRNHLGYEVMSAPYGQEPAFEYAGKVIKAYYESQIHKINKTELKTSEKDSLKKALVIKFMDVIQKNSGQVDSLINSSNEIGSFYPPEIQRE